MSRKDIQVKANRTWDVINLGAAAVGGAILTFSADTPTIYRNFTIGQVVGAILIATVTVRVAHLVHAEQR
jgi:hypothetical protein